MSDTKRDAVLKQMLNTPPIQHDQLVENKNKSKRIKKIAKGILDEEIKRKRTKDD